MAGDAVKLDIALAGYANQWQRRSVDVRIDIDGQNLARTTAWALSQHKKPSNSIDATSTGAQTATPNTQTGEVLTCRRRGSQPRPQTPTRPCARLENAPLNFKEMANSPKPNQRYAHALLYPGSSPYTKPLCAIWPGSLHRILPKQPRTVTVSGIIDIASLRNKLAARTRGLRIGKTRVSGKLDVISPSGEDRRANINGRLKFNTIAIPALARLLTAGNATPASVRERPPSQAAPLAAEQEITNGNAAASFWPTAGFDFSRLNTYRLNVAVESDIVQLTNNLALRSGSWRVKTDNDDISLSDFQAGYLGGSLSGDLSLRLSQSIATARGKLTATDIKLAGILPELANTTRLGGVLDANITYEGQGLIPRSLVSALNGSGKLKLDNAVFPGLNPKTLGRAARRAITGEIETGRPDRPLERVIAHRHPRRRHKTVGT